jgi:hypothetical protein
VQTGGAGVDGDGLLGADVLRKLLLEAFGLGAGGDPTRRVDLAPGETPGGQTEIGAQGEPLLHLTTPAICGIIVTKNRVARCLHGNHPGDVSLAASALIQALTRFFVIS